MKKILNLTFGALLLAGMAACSGSNDEPNNGGGNGGDKELKEPYTLSVDKAEIEADGTDMATFTITDANGNVLTDKSHLSEVTIRNADTGVSLGRRTNTFTALANGTYRFSASYQGVACQNDITVTAKNRQAYETYFRNVICYKITSAQCVACPSMTTALNAAPAEWKERMIVLAIHGNLTTDPDPWTLSDGNNYVTDMLFSTFTPSSRAYPTAIFNMSKVLASNDRNGDAIGKLVQEQVRDYPSTCGIKVTTRHDNGKILVDAALTSSTGGDYQLVYALSQDNLSFLSSGTYPDRDGGYYDHVCRFISSDYQRFSKPRSFHVEKDAEYKASTFEINLGNAIKEAELKDCSIVVFATRANDNGSIVDNATRCAIDATVDYKKN